MNNTQLIEFVDGLAKDPSWLNNYRDKFKLVKQALESLSPVDHPKVTAVCTWGEGPDVLVLKEYSKGRTQYLDLTIAEARTLRDQLVNPISKAESIEAMCAAYHAKEEES